METILVTEGGCSIKCGINRATMCDTELSCPRTPRPAHFVAGTGPRLPESFVGTNSKCSNNVMFLRTGEMAPGHL